MGFLDNTTVTVDAILTKKGRELLSAGSQDFNITKFALSDDEVDYTLWNPDHPNGSDYYGTVIQNMPLLEATSDETQVMKYKLITLPITSQYIPVIQVTNSSYVYSTATGQVDIIQPRTTAGGSTGTNLGSLNATAGYTAILSDGEFFNLAINTPVSNTATVPQFIGDIQTNRSVSVVGLSFGISPKRQPSAAEGDKTAILTLIGNETGGLVTINLTIQASTI
jgi:hypothetical protein